MAIDLTGKQKDLVQRGVVFAGQLQDLLTELRKWDDQRVQCGTFVEGAFVGSEHIGADDLTTLATRFQGVRAVVEAPYAGDILAKARR